MQRKAVRMWAIVLEKEADARWLALFLSKSGCRVEIRPVRKAKAKRRSRGGSR